MKTAGLLLAAGRSERFGTQDKLLAQVRGAPLVTHAMAALRGIGPDVLIAVTRSEEVAQLFGPCEVVAPEGPLQGDSLRAGIAAAVRHGADRALVVLGDMPLVGTDHLQAVLARCTARTASATTDGTRPMPPACFPGVLFPALLKIEGDQGARDLIMAIPEDGLVRAGPERLADVDTSADLDRLQ